MAQAFADGFVFPLPVHRLVFKLVASGVPPLHLCGIYDAGTDFSTAVLRRYDFSSVDVLHTVDRELAAMLRKLRQDPVLLDDSALSFTLPGSDGYELIPDGANTPVTQENVEVFVRRVCECTLFEAVDTALHALRSGVADIICPEALLVLSPDEAREAVCGFGVDASRPLWTEQDLRAALTPDGGYSVQSPPFVWLVEYLIAAPPKRQRDFVAFLTGCPHLPPGGLRALRPSPTIVPAEDPLRLPTSRTCTNLLRLPPYRSSQELSAKMCMALLGFEGFGMS
jgi:hypothetical protein